LQTSPKDDVAALRREVPPKPAPAKVLAVPVPKPAPKPAVPPSPETLAAAKPAVQTHTAENGTYYVQAGAFSTPDRAELAVVGLEQMGARVMAGTAQGRPIFRVRIGPFRNMTQAQAAIEQVHALGRKDALIVKDSQGRVASSE
jgi:cell division protein FtsN